MTAAFPVSIFRVPSADVRTLWDGMLGLRRRGLSPFAGGEAAPAAAVGTPDQLRKVADDPAFRAAASILADPDVEISAVTGGGSASFGLVRLYRAREADGARAVALSAAPGDAFFLHVFDDAALGAAWLARTVSRIPDFVAWDLDTLDEVVASFDRPRDLPDAMPVESAIYLLHALDVFRRAVYRSLLDHVVLDGPPVVPAAAFDGSLAPALRAGDVRWLLPAFHRLTPGLGDLEVRPRPEHLEVLAAADVLRAVRVAGEPAFAFGDVGARLGVEFYRTWHTAAGLAVTLRGQTAPRLRAFLAPTAFANHLFAIAHHDGHPIVRHQALDEAGLADVFHAALGATVPVPVFPSTRPTLREGAPCRTCGGSLYPADRFCSRCGTPVGG